MRAERRRTKKLIVAFHFQHANGAAWRCDTCRKSGLERARACGWMASAAGPERVVWARCGTATTTCPVSYISAESVAWLEEFQAWKLLGSASYGRMPARTVDAFAVLENEMRTERNSGEH